MERLTKYSEINKDYITPHCDNFSCNGCCIDCDYEQVIINKLAEYVSSGLEPSDVELEKSFHKLANKRLKIRDYEIYTLKAKNEQLNHDLAVRDKALELACEQIKLFCQKSNMECSRDYNCTYENNGCNYNDKIKCLKLFLEQAEKELKGETK